MPHSVTGSGGPEIETVILRTAAVAGGEATAQVDAQEDRAIVGWSFSPKDITQGNDHDVEMEAFVGVDPDVSNDTTDDLGGKFYDHASLVYDTTNGAAFDLNCANENFLNNEHWYDWNEDVTLTLVHDENASNSSAGELTLYYVEV
jgi:hypothetical protein